jgi:hypothetical protein
MKMYLLLILATLSSIPSSSQTLSSQTDALNMAPAVPRSVKVLDAKDVALVAAKSKNLKRLAEINGIDLDRYAWTQQPLSICPAFSKHLMVRYERTDDPKIVFVAVYPRINARIHLVVYREGFARREEPVSVQQSTVNSFNEIWTEERSAPQITMTIANLSWASLAACYAELSGEQLHLPPGVSREEVVAPHSVLDIDHAPIQRVVFEVVSESGANPSISMDFDRLGFIKQVQKSEPMKTVKIP